MDELAGRLARGEKAAFAELYDVCADRLYHYLAHRLGSRDAAGDVLQETLSAWSAGTSISPASPTRLPMFLRRRETKPPG